MWYQHPQRKKGKQTDESKVPSLRQYAQNVLVPVHASGRVSRYAYYRRGLFGDLCLRFFLHAERAIARVFNFQLMPDHVFELAKI
jgi:hypothetical protein